MDSTTPNSNSNSNPGLPNPTDMVPQNQLLQVYLNCLQQSFALYGQLNQFAFHRQQHAYQGIQGFVNSEALAPTILPNPCHPFGITPQFLNLNILPFNPQPLLQLQKQRRIFTDHQYSMLERRFAENNYIKIKEREEMGKVIGLNQTQILNWFNNRRHGLRNNKKKEKQNCKENEGNSEKENNQMHPNNPNSLVFNETQNHHDANISQ